MESVTLAVLGADSAIWRIAHSADISGGYAEWSAAPYDVLVQAHAWQDVFDRRAEEAEAERKRREREGRNG